MSHSITEILALLEQARNIQKDSQAALREYVTDKDQPIKDRFEVWKKYCDKEEEGWIIHKGQFGPIGGWVEDCVFRDYYERYQDIDWAHFYDDVEEGLAYEEGQGYGEEGAKAVADAGITCIEDFQEILIETKRICSKRQFEHM